ncbi:MAG: glycosyltransferase family 4 protein [Pseudomonadota bacterium]
MTGTRLTLAVPGDLASRTGGYIYDARLLEELRAKGIDARHLALPASFPRPSKADMDSAFDALCRAAPDAPLLIDGLAFGALDTARLATITAPLAALIHHPLALEAGLTPEDAEAFALREAANLAHARIVIVPSPHTASVLARDFGVAPSRITVARPGRAELSGGSAAPTSPPLILSVGMLAPRKGHDVLIRALDQVTDIAWRAEIVGPARNPSTAAALQADIAARGLSDRVTLLGEVSAAVLAQRYRAATVFALATRYEGHGMVFDEAMAHGLPVVATRGGAVVETVPACAGLLVDVDDATGFAEALRTVLSDPARRQTLARAAHAHTEALPRWTDTAARVAAALAL